MASRSAARSAMDRILAARRAWTLATTHPRASPTSTCSEERVGCVSECGDAVVNGPPGLELCDQAPPESASCLDLGRDYGLFAIAGVSSNDVYAAGEVGGISHWDGTRWSAVEVLDQSTEHIRAIWIANSESVWLAFGSAQEGGLFVGNYQTGFARSGPNVPATRTAIAGSDEQDIYAGGSLGTLLHYNGSEWSAHRGRPSSGILRQGHRDVAGQRSCCRRLRSRRPRRLRASRRQPVRKS